MTPTPPAAPVFSFQTFTTFPGNLLPILLVMLVVLVIAWILLFALGSKKPRRSRRMPAPSQLGGVSQMPPPTQERRNPPAATAPPSPTLPIPERQPPAPEPPPTPAVNFGLHFVLADGFELAISSLPAIIGRAANCDIQLDDESVSSRHARLEYDRALACITIEDLGSANGTQVNGRPTRKNILHHNDQLTFGAVTVTFQDTGFLPPIE